MLTKTNLPTVNQKRMINSKTKAKSLFVNVVLVLIFLTTNACAMNKEKSELYKRFSDELSQDYAKRLIEELYPNGSNKSLLVNDLNEIGFKCYKGKNDKSLYCEKSHFLGVQWFIEIEVSDSKINKIKLQKHLNLP